ncbi:MAG: hypothetical protein JXA77_08455 [Bacteroidales bacterium]|nr:hypothetical protein [Bacteroidales bacterium]MBN2820961.1 hypothetical protein [Bacteroidales bacterium]
MKKTFKSSVLLFLLISVVTTIYGQDEPKIKFQELSIGYWGTLNQSYGVKLGVGRVINFSEKYSLHRNYSLLLNRKPDVYKSAGIAADNIIRRTGNKGFYWEHGINIGYLGSIYDFDLFQTNSQGQIINVGKKWLSSVIFGYSLGFGYDFSKKTKADFQLFFRPGLYHRFPNFDNSFYINQFSIEAGVIWHPKFMIQEQQKLQ